MDGIAEPEHLRQATADGVYEALDSIQKHIDDIERSGSYHLSWPLIELLGTVFSKLVPSGELAAFYATMKEHNYHVFSYHERLAKSLRRAVPQNAMPEILGSPPLLCVELPSIEEVHPALHANVLHEFGHVLLRSDQIFANKFGDVWLKAFRPTIPEIIRQVSKVERRQNRIDSLATPVLQICYAFVQELVCDALGTAVFGPAFAIASMEMSWEQGQYYWRVQPPVAGSVPIAHPSYSFRIKCMRSLRSFQEFVTGARAPFRRFDTVELRNLTRLIGIIDVPPAPEEVLVAGFAYGEDHRIRPLLNALLPSIRRASLRAVLEFEPIVRARLTGILDPVTPANVVELIGRLEAGLTPNTVRERLPAGRGAGFQDILAAGLYYRLGLLSQNPLEDRQETCMKLSAADRLVTKAIELVYVQGEWKDLDS